MYQKIQSTPSYRPHPRDQPNQIGQADTAINAADTVTGVLVGRRSADQDHGHTVDLLRQAGKDGTDLARHLARLLPLKTKAEYEPDEVPRATAAKAVESARRAVSVARRVLPES